MPKAKEQARARVKEELNHLLGWEPNPEMGELGQPNPPPIKALYYDTFVLQ